MLGVNETGFLTLTGADVRGGEVSGDDVGFCRMLRKCACPAVGWNVVRVWMITFPAAAVHGRLAMTRLLLLSAHSTSIHWRCA